MPKSDVAFIRTKKINQHTYYYLVENSRIDGNVRQKVLKYLGKNGHVLLPGEETPLDGFLRVKRIKGHSYFYLVKNFREDGKVRQKVIRYLGKGNHLGGDVNA